MRHPVTHQHFIIPICCADLFDRLVILNTNSLPDGDGTDAARFPSTVLFNKFQIWNAPFQSFRSMCNIMRYGIPLTAIMFALGGAFSIKIYFLYKCSNILLRITAQ